MKTLITAAIALLTIAVTTTTMQAAPIDVLIVSGGATDVCAYSNGGGAVNSGVLAGPSGSFSWTTDTFATIGEPSDNKDWISLRGNEDGPNAPNTWGVCNSTFDVVEHPGMNHNRAIGLYIDVPGGDIYENHGGAGGGPVAIIEKRLEHPNYWGMSADAETTLHRWQGVAYPGQAMTFVEVMAIDPATQFVGDPAGDAGFAIFGGGAGPAGADGADGAAGAIGAAGAAGAAGDAGDAGADGATGAQGPQGKQGPAGDPAPCTPCAEVTDAAVALACEIMAGNQPASISELTATAAVIVDNLLISANICDSASCDINAGIQAALDAKLN